MTDNENAFDGFRDILSSTGTVVNEENAGRLTLETLQKTFDYLNSEEYHKVETEEYIRFAAGLEFIGRAFAQGIITPREHLNLLYRLEMFGALVVDSAMGEKLRQVQDVGLGIQERNTKLPQGYYLLHTLDDQWYSYNAQQKAVSTRFAGPYMDEMTARLWCIEQQELIDALGRSERGKAHYDL